MPPTIKLSKCCNAIALEIKDGYECIHCRKKCEVEDGCEWCRGTGEISTDEEDGEGHTMRGVGTEKCPCQIKEEEYDEDWSRG